MQWLYLVSSWYTLAEYSNISLLSALLPKLYIYVKHHQSPLLATENWYNLERMFGGLNKVLNWNWSLTLKFMQYDDIKLERKQKNSETSAKRKKGGSGLSFRFFSSVSFLHSYPFLVCPLLQGARRSFCPFWPSAIASSICQATLLTFLSLDALLLQRKTWNWKG